MNSNNNKSNEMSKLNEDVLQDKLIFIIILFSIFFAAVVTIAHHLTTVVHSEIKKKRIVK